MAMLGGTRRSGDRVLCLDGGGIRGLIILEILEAIEEAANKTPIRELFDWIGGTSTGGIIALGIAKGMEIGEIKTMYHQLKDDVFQGSVPYESAIIEDLLKEQFKDKDTHKDMVMTDIKKHKVIITSVLGDHSPWKLHLFRSYETDQERDNKEPKDERFQPIKPPHETFIWEAARSTSAAPTYFHPYNQFFDGGIMSNNPTIDMLTEILRYSEEREEKGKNPYLWTWLCQSVADMWTT